jgi:hypothetical protein
VNAHVSLPRAAAVIGGGRTQRRCANCGDLIDPIDWCEGCKRVEGPCGSPHRRARKRADAAFCDAACRHNHRATYIRDCA